MHFNLYEGYVKQTNLLNGQIAELMKNGRVGKEKVPAYSELTWRLEYEYNGMVFHEFYFGNMRRGGSGAGEQFAVFQGRRSQFWRLRHLEGGLHGN